MGDSASWCLIESDPGVFTELIRDFGVRDVQVREIYTLADADIPRPVYGLIFLFKWVPSSAPRVVADPAPANVFFAQQRIQNACATQAILSVLLNRPDIDLGTDLAQFREFTSDFPPDLKGDAITNSDAIRAAHNSFARLEVVDEKQQSGGTEDAFHFISYVPVNGRLYELDGLLPGPVDLGACPDADDWLSIAAPHIEERMKLYESSELRFSLLAVTRDKRAACREEIATIEAAITAVEPHEAAEMAARRDELLAAIAAEEELAEAEAKENVRRKHNWYPFVYQLLRQMARMNALPAFK